MLVISMSDSTRKIMIRILRNRLLPVTQEANMSTRPSTHYETLKVHPNATHNEIKSAYYKLTLKYHPDKNKTDDAKKKFQQISDAYEVIGSYTTRKQYDRQIQTKYGSFEPGRGRTEWPIQPDPHITTSLRTRTYDFNAWTEMHYKRSFEAKQERRRDFGELKTLFPKNEDKPIYMLYVFLVLFCGGIILKVGGAFDYDVPLEKKPPSRK